MQFIDDPNFFALLEISRHRRGMPGGAAGFLGLSLQKIQTYFWGERERAHARHDDNDPDAYAQINAFHRRALLRSFPSNRRNRFISRNANNAHALPEATNNPSPSANRENPLHARYKRPTFWLSRRF
ncbi:MAG: hypothetical protein J6333_02210 [Planctomycetes bacterium]|nr:hypothetical protein [Planctomycetota bacterium]